ncbi:hypothetical protein DF186_24350, partial [Enterococcus hirae]
PEVGEHPLLVVVPRPAVPGDEPAVVLELDEGRTGAHGALRGPGRVARWQRTTAPHGPPTPGDGHRTATPRRAMLRRGVG